MSVYIVHLPYAVVPCFIGGRIFWLPLRMPKNFSKRRFSEKNHFHRSDYFWVEANVLVMVCKFLQSLVPGSLVGLTTSCSPTRTHHLLHRQQARNAPRGTALLFLLLPEPSPRCVRGLTLPSCSVSCSAVSLLPRLLLRCRWTPVCRADWDPRSFVHGTRHALHSCKSPSLSLSTISIMFIFSVFPTGT